MVSTRYRGLQHTSAFLKQPHSAARETSAQEGEFCNLAGNHFAIADVHGSYVWIDPYAKMYFAVAIRLNRDHLRVKDATPP